MQDERGVPESDMATLADYMTPRPRRAQWKDPVTGKWLFFQELSAQDWAQLQADVGGDDQYLSDFSEAYKAVCAKYKADPKSVDEQEAKFVACYNEKSEKVLSHRIAALSHMPKLKPENAVILFKGLTKEQVKELDVTISPLLILSMEANRIKNSQSSPGQ